VISLLINGTRPLDAKQAIAVNDRGLHYGDGLFETMLLGNGQVRFCDQHLQRLGEGCLRLSLPIPGTAELRAEIQQLTAAAEHGIVKVLITRGVGGRGYAPQQPAPATRVMILYPPPAASRVAVHAGWCRTRLGRNALLAGMKHLNRLEQVLATMEQQSARIEEGLLLDTEGELISAISSNVFLVRDGALLTPDLRFCGVKGVMRAQVMRAANELGMVVYEQPLRPVHLEDADEVFITNAVRGVRSVVALDGLKWPPGPIAERLRTHLRV
jgi:4-amino-4-deoxychorismate lyase